jgi:hypothetical protein
MSCEFQKRKGVNGKDGVKNFPTPIIKKEDPNGHAIRNRAWRRSHLQRERKPNPENEK